jgi:predicted permease
MRHLATDIRLAIRSWGKTPALAAIVIASVALGIGANTAVFTLVDQVLLRPLPVHEPDRLVQITRSGPFYGSNWGDGSEISVPMYEHLRAGSGDVFDGMLARFGYAVHVRYGAQTERVAAELVSGTYFQTLGLVPAVGRTLLPDDDGTPGEPALAVLSHAFWMTRFDGDPAVVGRPIVVNSVPYTIAGVAPEGFSGLELGRPAQVFLPLTMKAKVTPGWNGLDDPRFAWVRVFGRLAPGVSREQALAALQPLYRAQIAEEITLPGFANAAASAREQYLTSEPTVVPGGQGRSSFRRSTTTALWMLMAIAAGLLLIATANVANLLLARAAGRRRETGIRIALGATRLQLARQLLVESLLLALAGGALGLLVARGGALFVLGFFATPELPEPVATTPDGRILAFSCLLAAMTGLLFGLAPAIQATRPNVTETLKDESGSVMGGGAARFRKGLVAVQVALALLMLAGAGLFIRTLDNLMTVDVGFRTDSLLSFSLDPSNNGYEPERARQFATTLLEQIRSLPGVSAAGLSTQRVLDGNQWNGNVTVPGYAATADSAALAWMNAVSPGYFEAMGIPVLRGREFGGRDVYREPPGDEPAFRVAIVNETFARRYFDGRDPVGHRIGLGADPGTPVTIEIVGLVRDSKYTGVRADTPPQVFFAQQEQARPGGFTGYVRTTRPAETMFAAVRSTVLALDPNLPVHTTRTLESQVRGSLRSERMIATMATVFGALATLLALIGLYGVMSYTVARRRREIGVRMALGAGAGRIARMVVREVLVIAGVGVALGLPLTWWLGRYVETQLFGVRPQDAGTLATAVVMLILVALTAGLVPAVRAARISPTSAMRQD